jgi:predicted RNase H-like nuclease (RuvC/YqgF family)
MNYELLSRLAIEDAEKSKNESFILRKRNQILHNEIDTLKAVIRRLEDEKENLLKEIEELKNSKDKEIKEEKVFTYYT